MASRIEDYALIGDCETAALVGRDGSIDWLCWPRFDSGAVFAALLGRSANGRWRIGADDPAAVVTRRYRGDTLILETDIETASGKATVIDFMPLRQDVNSHIVRILRGREGSVSIGTELIWRFDYGSIVPWVTRLEDGAIKAVAGPDMAVLRGDTISKPDNFRHSGVLVIEANRSVEFVMSYASAFGPVPEPLDATGLLAETEALWTRWCGKFNTAGPYSREALRSLITLKALTYHPTGGIVAAPTTSLPERIGGGRNWDYRYCWLRDATFTIMALMNCGYAREGEAWRAWLQNAVAGDPARVQVMYGLAGERRLDEWTVPWLVGYEASLPVRIGNAAARQLQIDIFGEVLDAFYRGHESGIPVDATEWALQLKLVEHVERIWQEPDEGIWEVRGGRRHFTHSKVMAWVALDRAVKTIEKYGAHGPVERWRQVRDEICDDVLRQGFDEELGAFVRSYGSKELDASALLIPLVGFLPPTDPKVASTVEAIGRTLMRDGLVMRYDTRTVDDGLTGHEGVFIACSFWYVDNLVLLGRRDEAEAMFRRLLSIANDVGLLAEEFDPVARRQLGNFPQAFSHVALINSALNLSRADKPAEQRSENRQVPSHAPST